MRIAVGLALVLQTLVSAAGSDQRPSPTPSEMREMLDSYDGHRPPARLPWRWTAIRVGTWNTMLQPWFPYRDEVVKTIARTNLDLLVLQEVWTEEAKNKIVSHPLVRRKYGYHYYTGAYQAPGSCPPPDILPVNNQEDYISCLLGNGVDTRTLEQPVVPVPFECEQLGLGLWLASQPCKQCLDNTMQGLSAPFEAINACGMGQGVNYSHDGQPGLLVLSKRPLKELEFIDYATYGVKRVSLFATVSGVRFHFAHWPVNYAEDISPALAGLQTGALQPQLAQDVISVGPAVVLGTFNSGPDYQPEGYETLRQNGYRPLISEPTYCPDSTHATFPPCQVATLPGPRSIDNIFIKEGAGICRARPFAEQPVSDHIGVAALCILKTR